jgi:hypothetical protein
MLALILTGCFNKQGQRHGQGTSGRIQRWCDCDYHHDYGAGVKGAARLRLDGANGSDSKFRKLCSELLIFGNLLEQSPPPFVHHYASGRPYPLGQLLPLVALGTDIKGKTSPVLYAAAIVLAFVNPWISIAIYVMVAVMWLVPDRRIENVLREKD